MDRNCLYCGIGISGRADKKYCSDTCRNSYNNIEGRNDNNLVRKINRLLTRNRKILSEMNPHGKAKTTRAALEERGFDFKHFTSIYETRKGGRYFFCYDQGYIFLEDHQVALVVRYEDLGRRKTSGKKRI